MGDHLSPYVRPQVSPFSLGSETKPTFSGFSEPETSHLRDYWQIVSKRRWLVILLFLSTVLATGGFLALSTPVYTAATTVLIEPQAPQFLEIKEVLAQQPGPEEYDYYKTQYELLRSQKLASRVIREQELESNRAFVGEDNKPSLLRSIREFFFFMPKQPEREHPLGVSYQILDTYLKHLEIRPVQGTRLTRIAFSSRDPELSARVANAHVNVFIRQGVELRAQANEEARQFLETKLSELKDRIEKSEAALNAYRRDQQILSPDDKENIVVGRLVDLNKLLTDAEAERIAFEAQMHLLRSGSYEYIPAITTSPLVQGLKEQVAKFKADYAAISTEFKAGFPRVDQLKAQLEEAQRRLTQEIQKIAKSVEAAAQTAKAKEKALRLRVEAQKNTALQLKDTSVTYSILARDVDTNRQLYDSVLHRLKEMGVATQAQASNISVVDPAIPPLRPAKPKKGLTLLVGAFIGLIGGIGLAFFFEYLDTTLKTPAAVARHTGLSTLAQVPRFAVVEHSRDLPVQIPSSSHDVAAPAIAQQDTPTHQPPTLALEAYRKLRTAILLSRPASPPRTMLFTSARSGEGKTSTAVNTAISLAQMGARVLLIDADLRNPCCHSELRVDNELGLTEFLVGQKDLAHVIQSTSTSRLFFIGSGALPPNPSDLLGSRKMQAALVLLRSFYDYIVIDSPPVLPVSDAEILSPHVDGVILVVDSEQTPYQIVRATRYSLVSAQAKIIGVVLNKAQLQSSHYSYYYPPSRSLDISHHEHRKEVSQPQQTDELALMQVDELALADAALSKPVVPPTENEQKEYNV